jgi:hypothetical protein
MKTHQKVVAEYFKLYVLLNMANRHRNEKTSVEFKFVEAEDNQIIFIAHLIGSSEGAKIQLAVWNDRESWHPSGYSGLHILEDHIVDVLIINHESIGLKLRRKPSEEHLKKLTKLIDTNLRSLGIQ